MIEHRNSGFVTTNGLVPVNTICDRIGKGKNMETLLKMFPKLSDDDVFEAIHFYSDNVDIPHADTDKLLALVNVGSKADETIIEVSKAVGEKCQRCWKILEKKCNRPDCPLK